MIKIKPTLTQVVEIVVQMDLSQIKIKTGPFQIKALDCTRLSPSLESKRTVHCRFTPADTYPECLADFDLQMPDSTKKDEIGKLLRS